MTAGVPHQAATIRSPGAGDLHASFLTVLSRILIQRVANLVPLSGLRTSLYRLSGVRIGKDVFIGEGVLFDKLTAQWIEIGDHAAIGARTIITAHQTIPTNTDLRKLYPDDVKRTVIEHDVWIMPGVIVTPGVTIGHHSVIATGAVIHKDVPPFSLVVGGGFRIAKQLDPAQFEVARHG
jgi:acetyltransferase-like isoleucine patch superfamily enzyme